MGKTESSNTRKVYYYYCRQDGHYSSQCPVKTNEKQPAVNMVIAEVADIQHVTTRSKGKTSEWEAQEAIWKQATKWIEKTNERNMTELREQMKPLEEQTETMDENPTWQALQDCQIMLPLGRLLQLVPRFTDGLKSVLAPQNSAPAPTFFSKPEAPVIVDTSNLAITVIVKGREIPMS